MADKKPVQRQEYATKEERLAALRAKGRDLNKKLGIEVISVASDLTPIQKASFGIPELDALTGGGIPHGNFTVLWGSPGCAKTSTAFKLVSTAQKAGKIVYYLALEPIDTIRAQQFGVNLDELQIGKFPQAEMALDTIIDYARNKLVDVIVLDSIHSLAPKGMQENSKGEKSLSEETISILARKLSEFFKVAADPIKRANIAVLLIGQTRTQIGFISIEALTGGNALHHAAKLIIRQRRGAKDEAPRAIVENDKGKKEEVIIGFSTVYKLDKVQVSGSKTEGSVLALPYYYETGFEEPQSIIEEKKEIAEALGEKDTCGNNTEEESAPLDYSKSIPPEVLKKAEVFTSELKKKRGRPKKS
jgi:RecA/RadA recombinase